MAVLFSPTALRALLLAAILACFAALTAPTARGADEPSPASVAAAPADLSLPLADEWSWAGFVKFWRHEAGTMMGILGTVTLVGLLAVFMILWKGK
jgi:hypothetical protein